jgi:hypothetical protein
MDDDDDDEGGARVPVCTSSHVYTHGKDLPSRKNLDWIWRRDRTGHM